MNVKKLVFAPIFLVFFGIFSYELAYTLSLPNLAFSFDMGILVQLLVLAFSAVLASLLLVVFAALAFDWRIVAPINLVAAILVLIFISSTPGLIAAVATFLILCAVYLMLERKLKSYLDFKPTTLFKPDVKSLARFLILISAVTYYLMISADIAKNGFQLPDSLIDSVIKLTPGLNNSDLQSQQLPQIPQDQIDLLKKNPQLLKQYGLDAKALDQFSSTQNNSKPQQTSSVKQLIKDQIQNMVKPYQGFIAPLLAILFYFSLTFFSSIFSLLISPLIWLIFLILEKTKFITFSEEQRTVKKMVV